MVQSNDTTPDNEMLENKAATACFTGHRIISGEELTRLQKRVSETITELIGQGISVFLSGGAYG